MSNNINSHRTFKYLNFKYLNEPLYYFFFNNILVMPKTKKLSISNRMGNKPGMTQRL